MPLPRLYLPGVLYSFQTLLYAVVCHLTFYLQFARLPSECGYTPNALTVKLRACIVLLLYFCVAVRHEHNIGTRQVELAERRIRLVGQLIHLL